MRATKERSADLSQPADAVLAAVHRVLEVGKYELGHSDEAQGSVAFTSGKTALSWGQEYLVRVTPAGAGSTLHVTCGSLDEAPKALLDGWKGGKAADKFIAAVRERLAG